MSWRSTVLVTQTPHCSVKAIRNICRHFVRRKIEREGHTRETPVIPHRSGKSCQYWSLQSCSRVHFGRCLGAICLRSASFWFFAFVVPRFLSLKLGVLILHRNPRCCTLWSLGEGMLVVIVTTRASPSLQAVYGVHDCFVDRHNKKTSPSKGQAWRLNKSPSNSGNEYIPGIIFLAKSDTCINYEQNELLFH